MCARAHHSFKAKAKSARQGTLYTPKVRQYDSFDCKIRLKGNTPGLFAIAVGEILDSDYCRNT